ncbi:MULTISPECIES: 3-phosphoshikimate 1-carboxyvinyltransferase [unclassified Chelatococcus]|uniref:3-phosphoshikimate 1-carboxyvinyltransferase n=1 Tax=unclassified Chelatococcus TaxID=2638111 RepID=UPI001BCE240E|nr:MULTISPECIES: 3-phosphoshikimate 1-carboxyvinyltransferase [unclassified Chelatococcus]CAH1660813.1 3-phosphoshikimate 1-carboxyvinyltransferase [Hyphomicrobiales bacterium]MBS7741172.1 3-phosphoshikimate 1-carboxyvinyltransferase [Chelatococcus sp. HY11]MBX3545358.1 3-phosphoshikimate 1-carboxyvinyltransferase [Chelatococcus sp.]MCO5077993.1 3-phosphoshikimate 1-carboxyvinyltransferase [Chelatococcus sp.]CAH1683288.1 3-phosphoshikimate 1-carboxyvinyltransferase [Hyphomicrobiales bacterium]
MTKTLTLVPPQHPLRGAVAPPGSKSITNRALLLAALANGTSRLTGALKSDDTHHMANALRHMGVVIDEPDATSFLIHGTGGLKAPSEPVFLGNAGTATRFLTAAAALANGVVVITGDDHMQKRPIAPLVTALDQLGVTASAPTGCPPVTVEGRGRFEGDSVTVDAGLSSQYISALLMLAAGGSRPVHVNLKGEAIGARGYVDLTCAAMRHFGARVEELNAATWVVQPGGYSAADMHIEPDASAATYLWAAEVLTGGAIDIGTAASAFTQPDARAHALISQFPHLPREIDGSQMQDAVPTLAVLAAFCAAPVRFTGIANLRVKECDRVAALANELSRLAPGLAIEDGDDLVVTPLPADRFQAAEIETYADHRIAMSLALAGLMVPGVTIKDPDCVNKTYPAYWQDLRSLGVVMSMHGT